MFIFLVVVACASAVAPSPLKITRRGFAFGTAATAAGSRVEVCSARDEQLLRLGEQSPLLSDSDVPFQTLPSGVKVKTLRQGSEGGVSATSTVTVEMTGRLLNLNGIKFYSTSEGADAKALGGPEPLVLKLGAGEVVPGLEAGLLGAKKGEIRRVIVPSSLGYTEATSGVIKPIPVGIEPQRALDSVVKNPRRDAALLFDVKVIRIR